MLLWSAARAIKAAKAVPRARAQMPPARLGCVKCFCCAQWRLVCLKAQHPGREKMARNLKVDTTCATQTQEVVDCACFCCGLSLQAIQTVRFRSPDFARSRNIVNRSVNPTRNLCMGKIQKAELSWFGGTIHYFHFGMEPTGQFRLRSGRVLRNRTKDRNAFCLWASAWHDCCLLRHDCLRFGSSGFCSAR